MVETDIGLMRTPNRINICINPECFRYLAREPRNWIQDNETETSRAFHQHRKTLLRDSGESGFEGRERYTKAQEDRETALDTSREAVRSVEALHRGYAARSSERRAVGGIDNQEYRDSRKTSYDKNRQAGTNGFNDSLGR